MKPPIIILGTSHFSEYVYKTIKIEDSADVVAFCVDRQYIDKKEFMGLHIVAFEDLDKLYDMSKYEVLITVGYSNMNDNRKFIFNKCIEKGYKIHTYKSSRAMIDSDRIGTGSIIMPRVYVSPSIEIGKCCVINVDTIIGHNSTIGDFIWFSGNVTMGGDVKVGNNCFIGMSCTLKNGINIAERTFVGANSYLADNTKRGMAYMGIPAVNNRKIKSDSIND